VSRLSFHESVVISSDYTGLVHAGWTGLQEEFTHLDYLGASWIIHTFYWRYIEPEQGEWDFTYYDEIVDNNIEAGIKVMGVLAYDNWWIHEDLSSHRYVPPHKLPDFLNYVKKTVEYFQGRVDAWCIWNEPNFHFWNGTNEEFFELSRQAADAVREVDSEVILLGGAFNRGVFGLPEKFIRGLFESGAMEKVNAIAFHPYEMNPGRTARLYENFRKIVDDYGFGDKIWITEVGYPTGGFYPTKIREKDLPEYVVKTSVFLTALGSKRLFWYQLFDPVERSNRNSEHFFGLTRSTEDYTSKGAEAFRLCAKYLSGTICYVQEPRQDGLPKSLQVYWFKGTEESALVIWNEGAGSRQVNLLLPGTNHLSHDIVSGKESPIPAETAVKAGKMPLFITWKNPEIPGEDKPVIIQKKQ